MWNNAGASVDVVKCCFSEEVESSVGSQVVQFSSFKFNLFNVP
jgi:hypothetical protein